MWLISKDKHTFLRASSFYRKLVTEEIDRVGLDYLGRSGIPHTGTQNYFYHIN